MPANKCALKCQCTQILASLCLPALASALKPQGQIACKELKHSRVPVWKELNPDGPLNGASLRGTGLLCQKASAAAGKGRESRISSADAER